MAKMNYKIGCNNCGKYMEVTMQSGFGDMGEISDKDLPKYIKQICACKDEPKTKKK